MVKVNGKEMNREQFKEWVQTNRLNCERKKRIEAKKNQRTISKSKTSV